MTFKHFNILCIAILCYTITSCSSVPFTKKHNLSSDIKQMVEQTYFISKSGDSILLSETHFTFTKNGRVDNSVTLNRNADTIQTTEKKLFFEKQTYPDLPNYYCKTRWKTNQRERISCYSQKKYKQNEKIVYYSKSGRVLKSEDNFTNYNTKVFEYKNDTLQRVILKDSTATILDTITYKCINYDSKTNCIALELQHSTTDSLKRVYRQIKY